MILAFIKRLTFRKAMVFYILATIWDCIMTIAGLHYTDEVEVGWVAAPFVELLGPVWGVIAAKSYAAVMLLAAYILHCVYKRKGRISPIPIVLTLGAILTAIGGSLWLFYY